MKLSRIALPLTAAVCLLTAGCASHTYYVPAGPPPPGYSVPPLIARADSAGFRAGSEAGARDAYNRVGHHPQRDRSFHDTPGYDPAMGPYGPYRDAFRSSYLRGYDQSYYRR
ncbi:hypothetical protein [Granulicella sp. L60]|jgi:hypothetical protein|uniref:hypothetical protein n=1 Tax=Granulicella sp. L60 TaxID=1641866 RepID=UPI00131D9B5D|nr:hypothetical protein [Granulicella sp. L60]